MDEASTGGCSADAEKRLELTGVALILTSIVARQPKGLRFRHLPKRLETWTPRGSPSVS